MSSVSLSLLALTATLPFSFITSKYLGSMIIQWEGHCNFSRQRPGKEILVFPFHWNSSQ